MADDLAAGRDAEMLDAWLREIPLDRQDERPGLILARATRLLAQPDLETTFPAFERDIDALVRQGDSERGALALSRLLAAMFAAGTRPGLRAEVGARWIGRLDPQAAALPAARVFQAIGCAYALRFDEAEAELDAAVRSVNPEDVILVYAAAVRAHFLGWARDGRPEALGALQASISVLDRDPGRDRLAFTPWLRMLRAYLLNDLGRFGEGLEEAERVTAAAGRRGFSGAPGRGVAWLRAVALAGLERWDELGAELAPPERAPDMEMAPSYGYRYHVSAAALAAARRDSVETCAHIRLAREGMRRFDPASDDTAFLCDLAVAAHQVGEADLAREIAGEARAAARAVGAVWQRARAAAVAAAVLEGEEADDLLAEALELSADPLFESLWTGRERRLAAPLLARALVGSLGPEGLAGRLLAGCGGEVLARCAAELADAPAAARVAFARAAARAMPLTGRSSTRCCATGTPRCGRPRGSPGPRCASVRGRRSASRPSGSCGSGGTGPSCPAPHSVVKGANAARPPSRPRRPRASRRALRRALAGARPGTRVGGPAHDAARPAARPPPGDRVRLVRGGDRGGRRDGARRDRGAGHARPDRPRGVRCGRPAVRWSARHRPPGERRGTVSQGHSSRSGRMRTGPSRAEIWPRRPSGWSWRSWRSRWRGGSPRAAAERWRRLVSLDPEREGWHRGLMRSYAAADERALALRQFHACRAVLRRRQGIEPGAETRSLYAAILREEPGTGDQGP